MNHELINSKNIPQSIGPYSIGVKINKTTKINETIYSSGFIGLDLETNELVSDDFTKQTQKMLENIKIFLTENGSSFEQVLKVTVYITDLNNFSIFNNIYSTYFIDNKPARSCVQVSKLPKNAQIEIDIIAYN